VAVDGAGELLVVGLATLDHRDGQPILGHRAVRLETGRDLVGCLLLRGVEGVRLLPQELRGPQEEPRAQLPAHDVVPQVHQQGQVAVRLDPVLYDLGDERLRRGADGQPLGELLAAGMSDPCDLWVEALDVLGFLLEQRLGHEEREIDVLVAGALDVPVQLVPHRFPDRVAVGADDHAAAHRRVVSELGLSDHVVVPAREVLRLLGDARDETVFGHGASEAGIPARTNGRLVG
jgi:hypothetical protein